MEEGRALLGLLLGAGLGLVFSSVGAGAGSLAVPVMLLVFHQPLSQATGSALAVVFGTAAVSLFFHALRRAFSSIAVLVCLRMLAEVTVASK